MFFYKLFYLLFVFEHADLKSFFSDFFDWRNGTMDRAQYYCGMAIVGFAVTVFLGLSYFLFLIKHPQFANINNDHLFLYVAIAVWIGLSPFQLSAFVRRLNDACMSRWIATVLLIPFIGNVLAMAIGAILPTGYGVERY